MSQGNSDFLLSNLENLINTETFFNDICFEIHEVDTQTLMDCKQSFLDSKKLQMMIITEGEANVNISKTVFFVQKEHAFIVLPQTAFMFTVPKYCKYILISFSLYAQSASKESEDFCSVFLGAKSFPFSLKTDLLEKPLTILEAKINFLHLLTNVHTIITAKPNEKIINNLSTQIISYLNANYSSSIQITDIAKMFNMSCRNISRSFKAQTGVTITNKLNEIRINVAKEYLATNIPIKEIAIATGYSNEYYFSAIFKKIEGISPLKFRKLIKSN